MADIQQLSLSIDSKEWVATTLDSLFDPHGLLSSGLALYNNAMLVVAGGLLLWLFLRAVVATGQHGQIGGKHSEVWFPIRFVLCVGLITPLPPVGLSAGQQLLIGAAKIGSNAANQIWSKVAGDIANMKPLTVPTAPNSKELAHGLWLMQTCISITNHQLQYNGSPDIVSFVRHDEDTETVLSADSPKVLAQCGSIRFPYFADPMALPLNREHVAAALAMMDAMKPAADALALKAMPSGPVDAPFPQIDFPALIQAYSARVAAVAGQLVSMNNESSSAREAFAVEASKGGWVQAGAWALRVMATNAELTKAMAAIPSTTMPRLDHYADPTWEAHLAGMGAADNFWLDKMGTSNREIAEKALGAGTDDSWLAGVDISRKWQGLYEHLAYNSEDAAVNPLAEISSLGHSMINMASGAVAAYVALVVGGDAIKGVAEAIPIVGRAVGSIVGMASNGLEKIAPAFWSTAGAAWLAGVGMAYLLPMLPYIYWLLVVARFLIRLVSGVLAVPLWAIAHLELDGEGMGEKTRPGYMLIIDVFVRPMVSVLGLIFGLAIMLVMTKLLVSTSMIAMKSTLAGHYGGISAVAIFSLVLTATLIMLMHLSMRMSIDAADDVLEMAGAAVARGVGGQDHHVAAGALINPGGLTGGNPGANVGRGGGGGKRGKGGKGEEEGEWKPSTGSQLDADLGRDRGPEGGHEPPKPA